MIMCCDWVLCFDSDIPGVNGIHDTIVIMALSVFQTKKNHIEKNYSLQIKEYIWFVVFVEYTTFLFFEFNAFLESIFFIESIL